MNSAIVLAAYFAMVLSPCFVATYGDLLSVRWMFALARRRRTHRKESFIVSFRQERYAMAVALEASFAAASDDFFAAPAPFLAPRRTVHVETPAFVEARQRIAARLAQLAVAQKLRDAAKTEETTAAPVEAAEPVTPAALAARLSLPAVGAHIRPRKPEPAVRYEHAYAMAGSTPASFVFREDAPPPLHERSDVAASSAASPPRTTQGPEAVPQRARKSGESDALEKAA